MRNGWPFIKRLTRQHLEGKTLILSFNEESKVLNLKRTIFSKNRKKCHIFLQYRNNSLNRRLGSFPC